MTHLEHRCDLRAMVDPAIRKARDSAPAGDYTIRIDEIIRCTHCAQRWHIEGHSDINGNATLEGERRTWWRWWL